jgi:FKBP-type peptidyl-prolyl cis-trans isomerase FkpA
MAASMDLSSRALRRLVSAMALPLLLAPLPVSAATAPKRKAPAAAPKPPTPNNSIIPLPLAPIVPATQRLCASRTTSGLGYTMLRAAAGPKPAAEDTALVNYVGYLANDGAVFDQGMRSPLPVGEVIAGFSEGLRLIARTGVVRLCIPAAMGYGAQASGPIPANSDLVFQVELLDFKTAAELEAMRKGQAAAEQVPQEGAVPGP